MGFQCKQPAEGHRHEHHENGYGAAGFFFVIVEL